MKGEVSTATFVDQVKQQLEFLRDPEYTYSALHVYVTGVAEPWEFGPDDDFEFHEDAGFLIVRRGPTDEDNNDNADVPELVFHLNAIVATQLV
jgi:hypothetical protein